MSDNPLLGDSSWYEDPQGLTSLLRESARSRGGLPLIEGYDVLFEASRGGQGVVYVARQQSTRRQVAIKVLGTAHPVDDPRRRRFEREIDLIAGLRHPAVVQLYDRGVTSTDLPFLVMEYVEGVTLSEYLLGGVKERRHKPGGSLAARLELFCRVCDAVSHAHQRGVIHRDLKPGNILIDADGGPRVLDFGLAKLVESPGRLPMSEVTATGQFMGTLAYASPEQVTGGSVELDTRSDVYSLGVILYEMLTGELPIETDAPVAEVVQAIAQLTPEAPSIRQRRGSGVCSGDGPGRINDELDTIVLKALAKDPARRYQSVAALADDVRRCLAGEPIEAKRDSGWYLFRKLLQRNKGASIAAGAFLVLLCSFAVSMGVMYQRVSVEADRANQIRIFLEDTLGSVGPPVSAHEVTVAEVLDEAVHWVEVALSDRPEIAADLRNTIGNSYRSLGRFAAAREQLDEALRIRRELLGPEHEAVARSLNALALLHSDLQEFGEAERLFHEAMAMRRRLLGDDHLSVGQVLQNLGVLSRRRGAFDEAERYFNDALAIRRAQLGDDHPDVAMCRFQLATLAELHGDLDQAEELHRTVLDVRRGALHEEHPDVARSLLALGELLTRAGRADHAEPYLREAVEIMGRIVPAGHCRLAQVQVGLGACLVALAKYDEAEALLLDSYSAINARYGAAHSQTVESVSRLIELYESWGKTREADVYRALVSETAEP